MLSEESLGKRRPSVAQAMSGQPLDKIWPEDEATSWVISKGDHGRPISSSNTVRRIIVPYAK